MKILQKSWSMKEKLDHLEYVMSMVYHVKGLAKEAGLFATYIPVAGLIGIYDKEDGIQLGVTFDGKRIKVKNQYFNLEKWLRAYKETSQLLGNFKLFTNGIPK